MEFEWDSHKAENIGFDLRKQWKLFFDPNGVEFLYDIYSDDEIRFRLLAISSKRLLLVGYTVRQEKVFRIITARKATAFETRYYNESKR